MEILLDLHGNPGGESGEKPCGRARWDWHLGHWRRQEALECLRFVAKRYKDKECVTGLQVANETGRAVDPKRLVAHFVACARAVREAGMTPEKVAVVCPYYWVEPPLGTPQRARFLGAWRENIALLDHCVLDLHYYQFHPTNREEIRGPLLSQVQRNGRELDSLGSSVVGEFSLARPLGCGLPADDFLKAQLETYGAKATHGVFFWTWSDGAGGDWSLRDLSEAQRRIVRAAAAKNCRPPRANLRCELADHAGDASDGGGSAPPPSRLSQVLEDDREEWEKSKSVLGDPQNPMPKCQFVGDKDETSCAWGDDAAVVGGVASGGDASSGGCGDVVSDDPGGLSVDGVDITRGDTRAVGGVVGKDTSSMRKNPLNHP